MFLTFWTLASRATKPSSPLSLARGTHGLTRRFGARPERKWRRDGFLPSQEAVVGGRLTKRFAVVQSGKVRCIGNYSESQISDAISILNKITVDGVDTITAMCCEAMKQLKNAGQPTCLRGRSFDLKSAYRQLPVSRESLKWARVCVYNPESRQAECFQQYTLPFGARASVVAFIRAARALQWLAHHLNIIVSCYYDDFVNVSGKDTSANSESTFGLLLDLLGWEYDQERSKADRMSSNVAALAVVFDLVSSSSGVVRVRRSEIVKSLDAILESGTLSKTDTAKLKGRLTFAQGQLFGRSCRSFFNSVSKHLYDHPLNGTLPEDCRADLSSCIHAFKSQKPRTADVSSFDSFLLFTDAAYEKREGGLGGVLLDSPGSVLSWFSRKLSKEECALVNTDDHEQVITELEALAVFVSLRLWEHQLRFKHVVCFLDNGGARGAILKARSSNKFLHEAASRIASLEEAMGCFRVVLESAPQKQHREQPFKERRTRALVQRTRSQNSRGPLLAHSLLRREG